MAAHVKTTVVGSYPMLPWIVGNPSRLVLRDAVTAVLKTQELPALPSLIRSAGARRADEQLRPVREGDVTAVRAGRTVLRLEAIDGDLGAVRQ